MKNNSTINTVSELELQSVCGGGINWSKEWEKIKRDFTDPDWWIKNFHY